MMSGAGTKTLARAIAFIVLYFALAEVGLPLRIERIDPSPVWLPSGLGLAAILLFGPRFWPVVAIAAFARTLWGGLPVPVAAGLAVAKCVEVLLGAWLIRGPGGFTGALDTVRNVLALFFGGAVLAPIAGAALATTSLVVSGLVPWSRFLGIAVPWWLGDGMGALIVVPVALAFVTPRRWTWDREAVTAMALIGFTLFAACELAFGRLVPPASEMALAYLPFPVIVWAALRFGVHGAAFASCLASLHTTIGTLRGFGPFVRDSPVESLVLLEAFMAVMVLTGLIMGAVISERKKVATALRDSQQRYGLASSAGRAGVWDWDLATDEIYVDPVLKRNLGYEDHEIPNTSADWGALVHPDDVELVRIASQRHLAGESPRFEVEHRMVHRDGTVRWYLARGQAQRDASGVPRRLTGTDVDITPRKKVEILQAGNNHVLELVAQGSGLGDIMDLLAQNVESQTDCSCVVRLTANGGRALRLAAAPSLKARIETDLALVPVSIHGGTCGMAAHTRKPAFTRDTDQDPSWTSLRSAVTPLGIRACYSVPILSSADDVLGTVGLYFREPRVPDGTEVDVAENSARLARVAIEHARARDAVTKSESSLRKSHEQVQHLARRLIAAQEEERRRVSREIHDGLSQQLAALSFEIGKLRATVAAGQPDTADRLAELQDRAAHLIDDARRVSHELHPSLLEHLGLVAAVRAYCDEVSQRGAIAVRFDPIRPPDFIAPETALCLFRVVQEGLSNATKHSGANAVQVTLRSASDTITLAIADNGCGFDPKRQHNGGLGLISMAERVRAIGGEFGIISGDNKGTRLEVRLSSRAPEHQPEGLTVEK